MKNKIEDLRNHLFETLEALKDEENPMPIDRALAIADVGRVIVDSAKAEIAFMNAAGVRRATQFIPIEGEDADAIEARRRLRISERAG